MQHYWFTLMLSFNSEAITMNKRALYYKIKPELAETYGIAPDVKMKYIKDISPLPDDPSVVLILEREYTRKDGTKIMTKDNIYLKSLLPIEEGNYKGPTEGSNI